MSLHSYSQKEGLEMSLFIDATTQVMDHCETEEELFAVGRRLKHETMTDEERKQLTEVYRECLKAIRIF